MATGWNSFSKIFVFQFVQCFDHDLLTCQRKPEACLSTCAQLSWRPVWQNEWHLSAWAEVSVWDVWVLMEPPCYTTRYKLTETPSTFQCQNTWSKSSCHLKQMRTEKWKGVTVSQNWIQTGTQMLNKMWTLSELTASHIWVVHGKPHDKTKKDMCLFMCGASYRLDKT